MESVLFAPAEFGRYAAPLHNNSILIPAAPLLSHVEVGGIIERLVDYGWELIQPVMKAHGILGQLSRYSEYYPGVRRGGMMGYNITTH